MNRSALVRELLARLNALPETREAEVQRSTARLIQGEFLTREAAEQTAASILVNYGSSGGVATT